MTMIILTAGEHEPSEVTFRIDCAAERARPIRRLACCCCGAATTGRQWPNLDTGFGLCLRCTEWIATRERAEDMIALYGIPGVHHSVTEVTP